MSQEPRTCLVTGASQGIGAAVAARLAADGHRVALTARRPDALAAVQRSIGGDTAVLPADLTEAGACDALVAAVEERWGPVEVLVANAGAAVAAPLARTTDEQWDRMLELNLTVPFRLLRRTAPTMAERGWGRVVVVASVASLVGSPYICAYTASKHGVLGLVRSAAAELARKGVTVNAVCPGYVDTPMTDTSVANISASTGRDETDARAVLAGKQAIGRLVTPQEVAAAVAACVENGAMTGAAVTLGGDGSLA